MLQILNLFDEIAFSIVSGIFTMVAKVYDIMINLVLNQGTLDNYNFQEFAATMYVLAGVFMLFRTAIGMIQMLINPDLINDKQAGASKLITRIVVSIVMLIAFVPNGLLFGSGGLFARVEDALLAPDGLVTRLMKLDGAQTKKSINNKIDEESFLIENVYAESKLECFYINVMKHSKSINTSVSGQNSRESYDIGNVFKVEFYSGKSGKDKILGTNYTYTVRNDQRIAGKDEYGKYANFTLPISAGNVFNNSFPSTCPKSFKKSSGTWAAQKDFPEKTAVEKCKVDSATTMGRTGQTCLNTGIMGGYSSFEEMNNIVKILNGPNYSVNSSNLYIKANTSESTLHNTDTNVEGKKYLKGINDKAIVFAQGTASSLQECTEEKQEDCKKAQQEMFETSAGNEAIVNLVDSGDLELGFIVSVITGLGLIIYLLILCVEILVRKFKLFFLEMLAPLPIISYIDPKDKVFNQWFKMYLSTYVDLFIKLIAISMAINLLQTVCDSFWEAGGDGFDFLLIKFFYIVAILVFAKLIPTMISKIFGIDSMGGSFKDIMGLGKAAAGFGAGAILGGAVGGITGAMSGASGRKNWATKGLGGIAGAASGLLGGVAAGAGSGSKGKIFGGANSIAARNANEAAGRRSGLNFFQRKTAGIAGSLGLTGSGSRAEEQIKAAENVGAKNKALKDYALGEVQKKGYFLNNEKVNKFGKIFAKDNPNEVVAGGRADAFGIDMKSEYNKLNTLNNMNAEDYASTTDKITDSNGVAIGDYQTALRYQQQRVVALEDYATADKINTDTGSEMKQFISNYNDAVDEANNSGIKRDTFKKVTAGTVDSKTLSNNKDAAIKAQMDIGEKNERAIKRSKYANNNKGNK